MLSTSFIAWFIEWYSYEIKQLEDFREKRKLPIFKWKYNCFTRRLLHSFRKIFCWPCCVVGIVSRKYKLDNKVVQTADGCLVVFSKETERIIGEQFMQFDKDQSKNVRDSISKFVGEWVELLNIYKADTVIARALSLKIVRLIDIYNDVSDVRIGSFLANRIRLYIILEDFGEIVSVAKGFKDVT